MHEKTQNLFLFSALASSPWSRGQYPPNYIDNENSNVTQHMKLQLKFTRTQSTLTRTKTKKYNMMMLLTTISKRPKKSLIFRCSQCQPQQQQQLHTFFLQKF